VTRGSAGNCAIIASGRLLRAKSSRNNTKFGLFATSNCVPPEEKEDYKNFCTALWTTLAPGGPVEERGERRVGELRYRSVTVAALNDP